MGSSSSKQAPRRPQNPNPYSQQQAPYRPQMQISGPRPVPLPPPAPPAKDNPYRGPIRPGGRLINGWKPWGGGSCAAGPFQFAGCNQQVLTQLALFDAMYTYNLISFAEYMRKVLGLTRSYGFMRSYFTPNAGPCHARLEKGKAWVRASRKGGFERGVFAFYMDPMYGKHCDWAHVANVLLPLIGKNPHNLKGFKPARPGTQFYPSAAEFAAVNR